MKSFCFILLVLSTAESHAGDRPVATNSFLWVNASTVTVPPNISEETVRRGWVLDFNADGKNDYVLEIPASCGNHGCDFELFDGKTEKSLGEIFATSLYFLREKVNGQPAVGSYGKYGASHGNYSIYAYDPRRGYEVLSSTYIPVGKGDKMLPEVRSSTERKGAR